MKDVMNQGLTRASSGGVRSGWRLWVLSGIAVLALSGCVTAAPSGGEAVTGKPVAAAGGSALSGEARQAMLDQADKLLAARQYEAAFDSYTEVLKGDETNDRAALGIAECYLGRLNNSKALAIFESLEVRPGLKAAALQGQGLALYQIGAGDRAVTKLQAAVELDPALWRAWSALGQYRDRKQDWSGAQAAYRKALDVNPGAPAVTNNLGMSYLLQGRYAQAEDAFRSALGEGPDGVRARANLRLALAWQGRYEEALFPLPAGQKAVTLNNVGYIAMLRGDYDAAERYLARALEASPAYYQKAAQNLEYLKGLKGAVATASAAARKPS